MIIKKSPEEIERMAAAGVILVKTLNLLAGKVRPGVTTRELDQAALATTSPKPSRSDCGSI